MSASTAARKAYDRLAADYDARWRHYIDATLCVAMEAIEVHGDETILDVACGTGQLERALLNRWPALGITGMDVSLNMLRQARGKILPSWFVAAEASSLPFDGGRFDWVVCANAFHYFRQPAASLAEMRRVLRPGGRFVLVDWCDDYLSCKLCSFGCVGPTPRFFARTRWASVAGCLPVRDFRSSERFAGESIGFGD